MALTDLVEDYLLAWVVLAVAAGLLVPQLASVTRASTLILAVMIGSISLTISLKAVRDVDPRTLAAILLGHVCMPVLAFVIARVVGAAPGVTVGFVVLGAVTPELVTPVMTELADGDTALATTALVAVGLGSVVFVPGMVALLVDGVTVPTTPIVRQLLVAVVVPMGLGVGVRTWWPERVGRYDRYYTTVSALMVVLVIGGVTAANAEVLRSSRSVILRVAVGAVVLNLLGYGLGYLVSRRATRPMRVASVLTVGMRDFAVAAALVVAAGLPTIASLPAVVFGVVEMTSSAGLAMWVRRDDHE
ncbi:bile acid:sodium symporter family protein [Halomarina rubra]|uniref:Bile acid:sodium symporter family protein n=1 Tax=Halomarina rubra TaxID=2071873 RepID=A0ABD6AUF9_9EURY|nr:bile acid:sodium symporter [Halomarina rubra]